VGHVATLCKCMCKTGSRYLPAFAVWKPFSERLPAVCVASHDGGKNAAACMHRFLFPSGENCCRNVRNAAISFRRVLPKSIEDIWWYSHFKSGRQSFEDDPRPSRPSTSHTEETVARVHEIIRTDRRLTIREVAEEVRIAFGTCQKILTEDLRMRCVTAKFVPRLLTAEQKDDRVSLCTDLCDRAQNDPSFMSSVITCDKCWVYGYDPETKQMSSQWKTASSPRPKKARQVKSNVKTMLIAFFDIDGLVHNEYVHRGQTVNKEFHKTVLQRLCDTVRKHRPEKWRSGNCSLHHDNAPAHRAVTTNEFLMKHNIPSLAHPPYSPDLALCDFFLFPQLKKQ